MGLIERTLIEINLKSKEGGGRTDARREKKRRRRRTRGSDTVMCRKNKFQVSDITCLHVYSSQKWRKTKSLASQTTASSSILSFFATCHVYPNFGHGLRYHRKASRKPSGGLENSDHGTEIYYFYHQSVKYWKWPANLWVPDLPTCHHGPSTSCSRPFSVGSTCYK